MAGRKKAGVLNGVAEELSKFLRPLRLRPDGSEITYIEMANRLGGQRYCSAATLSRADQGGDRLPRMETVTGYVEACDGTAFQLQHARRLHATATRARLRSETAYAYADMLHGARIARQQHPAVVPHPDYLRTPLDFQQALRNYRLEAGSLSIRAIEENASAAGLHIAKSSVHRLITTGTFPQWEQVEAFLTGCRPNRLPAFGPWRRAWRRIFGPATTPAIVANGAVLSREAHSWFDLSRHSAEPSPREVLDTIQRTIAAMSPLERMTFQRTFSGVTATALHLAGRE